MLARCARVAPARVRARSGLVKLTCSFLSFSATLTPGVSVAEKDKKLQVSFTNPDLARTRAGATRAHLANMVRGVTKGYEKKLELVGVGFRAQIQGKNLNLT